MLQVDESMRPAESQVEPAILMEDEDPPVLAEVAGWPVVFVGEDPGPRGKPGYPLFPHPPGCAGHRLYRLCGVSFREYVLSTCRINLLPEHPGGRWPKGRAAAAAECLRGSNLLHRRSVVLLGNKVWEAFYGAGEPLAPCTWRPACMSAGTRKSGSRVALLPHPSGRNRWYNSAANEERARAFLSRALEESRR